MKKRYFYYLAIVTLLFLFGRYVIIDFSGPLTGNGDTNSWEYIGYYFSKNFSFNPLPSLNLENNQVFYPYGTSSVFQSWGLERDIFYSVMSYFGGTGPWLQSYYLLSLGILIFGSFLLLEKDFGENKAFLVSLFISFLNYYGVSKYPDHLNICIYHWTALGIFTDFIILHRFYHKQVSLKLLLFRLLLLTLSFGQDLGYITGFALTSFVFCFFTILINLTYQFRNRALFTEKFKGLKERYIQEFNQNRKTNLFLITSFSIFTFLYLPLINTIVHEAKQFPQSEISQGVFWASPLRLFMPVLFNYNKEALDEQFNDVSENLFDARPGYFLLFLGLAGFWQNRKKLNELKPFILLFIICLLYHPVLIPILKIFPWFSFNRVGGRSTIIYPVLLSLFFLKINFQAIKPQSGKIILAILIPIGVLEIYSVYSHLEKSFPTLNPEFFSFMDKIKNQPGEAVLDFPFCIAGGNGVGIDKLCPYYALNSGTYSYKRFHQKKVIGQYFGRLHPKQIDPFISSGWNKLFFPDNNNFWLATKQSRCFNDFEWDFFTKQYLYNDFSGINLYTDLLPDKCIDEFYRRFGKPVAFTKVPLAGNVVFIAKPDSLRKLVNPSEALKVSLIRELDKGESDLLKVDTPETITLDGISHIEKNSRWSLGAVTSLEFYLSGEEKIFLKADLLNYPDNQKITVTFNQEKILEKELNKGESIILAEKLKALKGHNSLKIEYSQYYNFRKINNLVNILKYVYETEGFKAINLKNIKTTTKKWKNKAVNFQELKIIKD
jgi:hypothetical protein